MNGFIPNTLNNQTTVAVAVPSPPILMNGGIVTNQQQQSSSANITQHQLVHYVHNQGVQPQLLIPNRNVIQITNGPQQQQTVQNSENGTESETIYVARQPYHSPVFIGNGTIPGHQGIRPGPPLQDPTITLAPRATLIQQQPRLIHMTPNGLYATTAIAATTLPNGQLPAEMATTLIITKPPPPKCLHCCLACCGLESLWFNPSFHFSRVIALICNILVDLLMILCLLSTNWLTTVKYRQGLWQYCIDADSPRPLPFGLDDHDGCHWGRNAAYIKLSGFFAVACFSLAIIATILTSFGLSSRDPNKKYTFYRFALYINLGALLAIIVSLTLYPAFFYSELHHTNMVPSNRPHWYFGWAYGVGWGAAIFLVGSILLLVCDKETEEIYYQERTIVHAANNHLLHNHQSIKA